MYINNLLNDPFNIGSFALFVYTWLACIQTLYVAFYSHSNLFFHLLHVHWSYLFLSSCKLFCVTERNSEKTRVKYPKTTKMNSLNWFQHRISSHLLSWKQRIWQFWVQVSGVTCLHLPDVSYISSHLYEAHLRRHRSPERSELRVTCSWCLQVKQASPCCVQVPESQVRGFLTACSHSQSLHRLQTRFIGTHRWEKHSAQRPATFTPNTDTETKPKGSFTRWNLRGGSPESSPEEKPGSETQQHRGEVGGWNRLWKLINKNMCSASCCVLSDKPSEPGGAGSTRNRCIKL